MAVVVEVWSELLQKVVVVVEVEVYSALLQQVVVVELAWSVVAVVELQLVCFGSSWTTTVSASLSSIIKKGETSKSIKTF